MESMPSTCFTGDSYPYAQRHDPFVYFDDVRTTYQCANTVPFASFSTDLSPATTTADYVWITPNLCHDMHDCSISTGDNWLQNTLPIVLNSPAYANQNSLVLVTWDEDDNSQSNQVATFVIAKSVPAGYHSTTWYSHYSLLSTIEHAWGLAPLTANDSGSSSMSEFFNGQLLPSPTSTPTPTSSRTATPTPSSTPTRTTTTTPTPSANATATATPVSSMLAVPGSPADVVALAGKHSAMVSWQAPTTDGGCTIGTYTVTTYPGGAADTTAGSSTSLTLSRLSPNTAYTFTVAASNCVGTGPSSAASNPVTPTSH
jgi:hypothetical protein